MPPPTSDLPTVEREAGVPARGQERAAGLPRARPRPRLSYGAPAARRMRSVTQDGHGVPARPRLGFEAGGAGRGVGARQARFACWCECVFYPN